MRRVTLFTRLAVIVALTAIAPRAQQPTGYDLFQQALAKERAAGEIEDAIRIYQRIVEEFGADRVLAAKALVQMGRCYETLGRNEARAAYERVVREFADQAEPASEARRRLTQLGHNGAGSGPGAFTIRRIWAGPDVDVIGAVSPDGRYQTFVDRETGDLALRVVATGEKRRLTGNASSSRSETGSVRSQASALYSRFSPDGRQIVFMWNADGEPGYHLRLIGIDGTGNRLLYRNDEADYTEPGDWSSDGTQIVVRVLQNGANQIGLLGIRSGTYRPLKTLDWRYPGAMVLSPDGRYVAYDFPPDEHRPERDVFLLAVDGSHEVRLVEHPASDWLLGWTPDGAGLLFASNRAGTSDIWMVPVAGGRAAGAPRRVRAGVGAITPLGLTREGTLFYAVQTGLVDVHVADLDPRTGAASGPRPVNEELVGASQGGDWSPDGRSLAYVIRTRAAPGGSSIVAVKSLADGKVREIRPEPRLEFIRWLRWSPDGRTLLARAVQKTWGLFAIDVQSGATSIVERPPTTEPMITQAAWSPDGRTVFFAQGPSIKAKNQATGEVREVAQRGAQVVAGGNLVLSPDGRTLAFSTPGGGKTLLQVMDLAAPGAVRTVLQVDAPEGIVGPGLAWAADGRSLLVVTRRAGDRTSIVLRVPLDGREPVPIGLRVNSLRDPRVSPDGRRLAFTAGEEAFEVWSMEKSGIW